jgi:tetratricopeptide (TPR) repeat protein
VNLAAGQDEINCTYCGTLVKRPEAEAQFAEIKNSKFGGTLLIAETAQEGGSYTEALNYYNKVIEQRPDFADAWLNKGICMVRRSKIGDLKIPEAISSWRAAIKFAKNPDAMKKRVALEINNVVSEFYPVLEEHYRKFSEVDDAYEEQVRRFNLLDSALALALEFSPESKTIAENGIALCDRFVESVKRAPGYGSYVADKIAAPVNRAKMKYEQVLAKYDSAIAARLKSEETRLKGEKVKQQFQAASQEGSSKSSAGAGCLLLAILLVILLLVGVWRDYSSANVANRVFMIGLVVPAVGALVYAAKRYNRKQNERDKAWLKDLPACFGVADLRLGFHPTEEEHFRDLVKAALKVGFWHYEIRSEIEKYLKERKCTAQHVREQLERFDVLIKKIKSGSV